MSTSSSTLIRPETSVDRSQSLNDVYVATVGNARIMQLTKSLYQADQQQKFLNLQEEVQSLLQQLQTLKQQKLESASPEVPSSHDASHHPH